MTDPSLRLIKIGAGYPTYQILTYDRVTLFALFSKVDTPCFVPFDKIGAM